MITETETMNTRPHQDLSQAGYPGRVRMMPLGQTLWGAQGLKSLNSLPNWKTGTTSSRNEKVQDDYGWGQ